ncbi:hypothetical protein PG993_010531 [Apiospora rasikravindrae]|uniref:FAD-binding PCMH-type domain-containing protein n=1 Tax=Apiospora rasikravindrae TaxID=990691 RepID=A0ABR1SMH8_9PEZI
MFTSSALAFLAAAVVLSPLASSQSVLLRGKLTAFETVIPGSNSPEAFQLTDAVLANLTSLDLANVTLFRFDDGSPPATPKCKAFPGENVWPTDETWNTFNALTGGKLITPVPLGAVCYGGDHYDAAKCQDLLDKWDDSTIHTLDPTSMMWPLFQGSTCLPQNAGYAGTTCEYGGSPVYVVNVTRVADVQLAVNFARNTGVRLVVRNTGHDYVGKSTGAGSLSIWTHHLKDIDFIPAYSSPASSYTGPAIKMGAGIAGYELYEAADKFGVSALSGEGRTVGTAGGYTAGGGLSPLTGKYGMAADQVLSIDVVTPDGRFATADETNNPDLFWALRGGGGGTFGVVTSMTVRAHPRMTFSGLNFTVTSGTGRDATVSNDVLYAALDAYMRHFPEFAEAGTYAYATLLPSADGTGHTWTMMPWLIPDMELDDFRELVAPLLAEWKALKFPVEPEFFTTDSFLEAYEHHFPSDQVGMPTVRTASRLIPKENWANPSVLNDTISTLLDIVSQGSSLIFYCINGGRPPAGAPPSAVQPAWRTAYMFAIVGTIWDAAAPPDEVERINVRISQDWMARLRSLTPGGGTYLNEADVMEPQYQEAFYGYDNYQRLLRIKRELDPHDVFWAPTAVGSEGWYVKDQKSWLTLQTGQLCPVGASGAATSA